MSHSSIGRVSTNSCIRNTNNAMSALTSFSAIFSSVSSMAANSKLERQWALLFFARFLVRHHLKASQALWSTVISPLSQAQRRMLFVVPKMPLRVPLSRCLRETKARKAYASFVLICVNVASKSPSRRFLFSIQVKKVRGLLKRRQEVSAA